MLRQSRLRADSRPLFVIPFMIAQFIIMFAIDLFHWLVTGPSKLVYGGH